MDKFKALFERRKRRVRYKLSRTLGERPRLSVFRSNSHMYAQIIDVREGKILVSASTLDKDLKGKVKSGSNKDAAKAVGELIANRAKKEKISDVVFDRSGYLYHGRVAALADAARENGLAF